ncbi:MAG: hypothetical protein E3J72_19335 [Planctomycetota bacterium]|nr:MAG: hypothetical protein E3J72_19335 [Planctomycetota bacterium]
MDTSKPKQWTKLYTEKLPILRGFTNKLHELVIALLEKRQIDYAQSEKRTKTVESFKEKTEKRGKSYSNPIDEITDACGIRIIAYYKEDVEAICDMIKEEFYVDDANSVDKSAILEPDRFGYLSVHFVIKLSSPRKDLPEWSSYMNILAEIQVRTVLQHAWALIDHKLRYKSTENTPRSLWRPLYCFSALFELADREFSNLREQKALLQEAYTRGINKGELDIDLNNDSIYSYIKKYINVDKWIKLGLDMGCKKADLSDPNLSIPRPPYFDSILGLLKLCEIHSIKELNDSLDETDKESERLMKEIIHKSTESGFTPFSVPRDLMLIKLLCKYKNKDITTIIEKTHYEPRLTGAIKEVLS